MGNCMQVIRINTGRGLIMETKSDSFLAVFQFHPLHDCAKYLCDAHKPLLLLMFLPLPFVLQE
jgi:hypothetical protein